MTRFVDMNDSQKRALAHRQHAQAIASAIAHEVQIRAEFAELLATRAAKAAAGRAVTPTDNEIAALRSHYARLGVNL